MRAFALTVAALALVFTGPVLSCEVGLLEPVAVADFLKDPLGSKQWRGPLTAADVESEVAETIRSQTGEVPPVPFGYGDEAWMKLRVLAGPNDRFFWFSSPKAAWKAQRGHSGYALVCDDLVIGIFTTELS